MDIIYKRFSIGTLLQQMQAQKQGESGTSVFLLNFGYNFSSEDNKKKEEELPQKRIEEKPEKIMKNNQQKKPPQTTEDRLKELQDHQKNTKE